MVIAFVLSDGKKTDSCFEDTQWLEEERQCQQQRYITDLITNRPKLARKLTLPDSKT